ncbi:MAG: hypothetical protein P8Z31_12440 [Gammaproteobacteria bacterium]|jgi:hypothetical protein
MRPERQSGEALHSRFAEHPSLAVPARILFLLQALCPDRRLPAGNRGQNIIRQTLLS